MTEPPAAAATTEVLLSAEEVRLRVTELAGEIARDHRDTEELVCLGVLRGSVFFLVDLVRELPLPVAVDFFQAASYGRGAEPGEVVIKKDVELPLRGRDVLLVEDIVDTGHTVASLLALLRHRRPRSLRLCALLDKPSRREVEVPID